MRPPFRIQIPVAEAIVDKTYTAYYTADSDTCCHCNEILYKGNGCGWLCCSYVDRTYCISTSRNRLLVL